jgi:hypothetical protein
VATHEHQQERRVVIDIPQDFTSLSNDRIDEDLAA